MPRAPTPSFAPAVPTGHGAAECGPSFTGLLLKVGMIALVANEVRGLVLAAPVLYGMYTAGGSWLALWIGFCSLAGIAVSVAAPLFIARRLKLLPTRQIIGSTATARARRGTNVHGRFTCAALA